MQVKLKELRIGCLPVCVSVRDIGGGLHLSPSGAFLAAITGTPLVIYAFHRRIDGTSRRNEVPCDAGRNEG